MTFYSCGEREARTRPQNYVLRIVLEHMIEAMPQDDTETPFSARGDRRRDFSRISEAERRRRGSKRQREEKTLRFGIYTDARGSYTCYLST